MNNTLPANFTISLIVVYLLCTVLSSSVYRRETESLALMCKCCVLSNQRIKCIPLLVACFMPHLSIGFVVDKVALGQGFPQVLQFILPINIPTELCTFIIHRGTDKSLAFPTSPTGGLQHNQKNYSRMG
jgi:hypothetical protein